MPTTIDTDENRYGPRQTPKRSLKGCIVTIFAIFLFLLAWVLILSQCTGPQGGIGVII